MNRARNAGRFLQVFLVIAVLLGLVALLGDWLSRLLWFWLLALEEMWAWVRGWPGAVWWGLALGLFALLGLRAWLLARPCLAPLNRTSPPRKDRLRGEECPPGPVARYVELLSQAELGHLLQRNLWRELARVAADRLALHEDLPEDVAWKRVRLGEWPAPPAVRELLKRERTLPSLSLRERLRRAVRRPSSEHLRKELEEAIAFLERYGES